MIIMYFLALFFSTSPLVHALNSDKIFQIKAPTIENFNWLGINIIAIC